MRIVDFYAFPDRSELRGELVAAFENLGADDVSRVEPVEDDAALGVGFDAALEDDELTELASDLRDQLEAAVTEDMTVRFQIADADSETAGGAPDHTE